MNSRDTRALTPREQEVIELLSTGLTNEEIARQLDISLDGVKYHVSGILRRLRVENRREAASLHLGTEGGVLTPRELEVIELLSTGLTNEEIARQLGISLDGVKYHVSAILRRLDVGSRREAASLHLRTEGSGRFAALAPMMFLRKLPFVWLPKAAAGAVLTTAAAGIALLLWGVWSTSTDGTTTGCISVEQSASDAPPCGPGVAQAPVGADAVTAISTGNFHSCAVKGGGVWCWGYNCTPGCGEGIVTSLVAAAVPGLASGVSTVSAGIKDSCAVKDGGVWCWNWNGDTSLVPTAVSGLTSGVSAISAGLDHSCALKDGGAWCWGSNSLGLLGNNSTTDSDVPVPVSGLTTGVSAISLVLYNTCALRDGGAWCWGPTSNLPAGGSIVPVAVSGLASGVSAISTGPGHTCAVKGGGAWCWGDNNSGQLGNNNTQDPCGLNFFPCSHVPVAVPGLTSGVSAVSEGGPANTCALKDGGVWCWGVNSPLPVAAPGLAGGVSAISAGWDHNCALKDDGVWCWGGNELGQLGNARPAVSDVAVPVLGLGSGVSAIEGTCALKAGGVWCWGSNDVGQLGNNSTTDSPVPVMVSGLGSGVSAISAGPCALKTDGLWCWGSNNVGQLGNNSTTDSPVPVPVSGLAGGVSTVNGTCALKDGAVLCWGLGLRGAIDSAGDDSMLAHVGPMAVPGLESGVSAISSGYGSTCALQDGGVWCWGFIGPPSSSELSHGPVALSGLESGVSALSGHCALKDGGVWCWFLSPPVAMPGLGSGVSAISGSCGLKGDGVWCSDGTVAVAVPGLERGVSALSGSCALKEGGVWCWGSNSNGQLGDNSPVGSYSLVPVAVRFPSASASGSR
ncbi:MAG: LuxR C-terminal-related transcriptional regulator [Chloroflexota bacterium]|nr:LuxR C-terminal-related transcriptional regulator [Chloroflexota bacterium]